MRIEEVQVENIRSHLKSTVPFLRGFNCLVGGLGTGKSSILYALDFAFFGEPIGRSFEYLLREDADRAKTIVRFSQNGQTYKLIRGLKKHGKGIGQDFEELKLLKDEKLIASIKSDAVAEQLKAITGLDKDLYREIIWVRQEHLKELLDATPRERQKRLDELFGLADYETAWKNIAVFQRDFQTEMRVYEKDPDVLGLEKLSFEYMQITEEFSYLEIKLQDAITKLAEAKKEVEAADSELEKIEKKQRFVEELARKEAHVRANNRNLRDIVISISERITGKRNIVNNLKQRQISILSRINQQSINLEELGVSTNKGSVGELQDYLITLDSQISSLKAEEEATLFILQKDEKRTASLSIESRCPLCLQPLDAEYKEGLMERLEKEKKEKRKKVKILQTEINKNERIKAVVNEAVSNLQTLIVKNDELKTRISDEQKSLDDLSKDFEAKKQIEKDLEIQLRSLQKEIERFDVSDLKKAREKSKRVFRQYSIFESDLRTKENHKKNLQKRLNQTRERIDHAQEKVETIKRISEILEAIGSIRDAYRSIQPKMRREFIRILQSFVQQVLDGLVGSQATPMNIKVDENYTPYIRTEGGSNREVVNLSGGERTLLAFGYRLGLGQLIMQSRTGHGLNILLLDEPTESLGKEDGSIERLSEAISRFKAIEQIIAVTHSEAFAEKAEHVVKLQKETGISKVSLETE